MHRGNQLNLNVYSRAELRGSDHKPGLIRARFHLFPCVNFDAVFAIYDAEVRIIDRVKKAALSEMLLESITFMEPGQKLDKKFANLVLPADPRQCMNLITLHSLSH